LAGGLALAVGHIPYKCKALSSNPSTAKKKVSLKTSKKRKTPKNSSVNNLILQFKELVNEEQSKPKVSEGKK
jgi:hypothetical protein